MTLILLPSALAGWSKFEYDLDEDKKPWQEAQTQPPAYPRPEHLVPFEVSAASRSRYYKIPVGEDGVVRYTVVVRTPGGAENVRFEGTRCDNGQHKLYAFGARAAARGGATATPAGRPFKRVRRAATTGCSFTAIFARGKGDFAAIRRYLRQEGLDRRDRAGVW